MGKEQKRGKRPDEVTIPHSATILEAGAKERQKTQNGYEPPKA